MNRRLIKVGRVGFGFAFAKVVMIKKGRSGVILKSWRFINAGLNEQRIWERAEVDIPITYEGPGPYGMLTVRADDRKIYVVENAVHWL
jgi:hypothetical protein